MSGPAVAGTRFVDCGVVTAEGRMDDAGVVVTDGEIVSVGRIDSLPSARRDVRPDGNLLVPGITDDHVHTRTPGHEYKEDRETATLHER